MVLCLLVLWVIFYVHLKHYLYKFSCSFSIYLIFLWLTAWKLFWYKFFIILIYLTQGSSFLLFGILFFLLRCLMDIWWIEVSNFNSTKIIFLSFLFVCLVLGKESLPVVMQIFYCIVFHLKLCFVIFHILNFALLGGVSFLYDVVFRDLFTWLPSCPDILY